jgi:nucleoside-diphosphate-sugar epimerase
LVSDGEDVSTTGLLRRMGQAMGRPARLIPVPAGLLKLAAALVGKRDVAQRLCGSLPVDIEKTRRLLGWTPMASLKWRLSRVCTGSLGNPAWKALLLKRGFMQRIARGEHAAAQA